MSKLVQVPTNDGPVLFDVDEIPSGPDRVSRRGANVVVHLDQRLDEALAAVRPAARAVVDAFKATAPDELSIEFGLRIDAEAGAIIAKTGASGPLHRLAEMVSRPRQQLTCVPQS